MSKNTNLSFLTDYITADITNGRIGINNASPTYSFDVTGVARTSTSTYLATASGNVGIGTTSPSSLSQFQKFLHIDGGASNNSALCLSGQGLVGQGTIGYDSNVLYIDALGAATGTNNNITFNTTSVNSSNGRLERMRITATGNVGIGSTSAASNYGFTRTLVISNPTNAELSLEATTSAKVLSIGVTNGWNYFQTSTGNGYDFQIGTTSKMVITSAGNVGIGVSSLVSPGGSRNLLQISNGTNGGQIALGSSTTESNNARIFSGQYDLGFAAGVTTGNVLFYTNDTERMRITSGGAVLINTSTSNSYPLELEAFTGGNQIYLRRDGANAKIFMGGSTGASTALYIQSYNTNGVYLTAGGTSWTANSDIRLKNIISPIDSAVDKLTTLNPVIFSWKSDEANKENIGLIAQDVKEVFPQVIDTNEDGFLGVRYVELVPVLVKAIQELKAEIETLKNK